MMSDINISYLKRNNKTTGSKNMYAKNLKLVFGKKKFRKTCNPPTNQRNTHQLFDFYTSRSTERTNQKKIKVLKQYRYIHIYSWLRVWIFNVASLTLNAHVRKSLGPMLWSVNNKNLVRCRTRFPNFLLVFILNC